MTAPDLSAYLVLDAGLCGARGLTETARAAVRGGIRTLQLRMKGASTPERIAAGRALQAALVGTGAALIVNDDAEAAVALAAEGLHIGQTDLAPAAARARIGRAMALGLSVETPAQAARVDPALVDHAGIGPVFATRSKPDAAAPLGLAGLAATVAACPVPAVAIGGLTAAHAPAVLAAGARGIAVVAAICAAPDPEAAARALVAAVRAARNAA
jgi:thiamine-phosphate pyrophosphorylase